MVTQKNNLIEMVLLSTKSLFKLLGEKIITIYAIFFFAYLDPCLSGPMLIMNYLQLFYSLAVLLKQLQIFIPLVFRRNNVRVPWWKNYFQMHSLEGRLLIEPNIVISYLNAL